MKSFKGFLKEETMPFANVRSGGMDIEDSAVRDNINSLLAGMTNGKFVTPYIALERVAKTLANFHIFLPAQTFLEGDSGTAIVPINQYGLKMGQNDSGEVVTVPAANYTVFFEYRMSDCGMFEIFCEVVDEDELDEILTDLEAELNGDTEEEDLDEEAKLFAPEMGTKRTPGSNQVPMTTGVTIPSKLVSKNRDAINEVSDKKKSDYNKPGFKWLRHFQKAPDNQVSPKDMAARMNNGGQQKDMSAITKQRNEEEAINELSTKMKARYVKKAESDKMSAERQARFSDAEAKDSGNSPERKKAFGKESEWLKGVATKRAKGIAMAKKKMEEETLDEISDKKALGVIRARYDQDAKLKPPPKREQSAAAAKILARRAKKIWLNSNVGVMKEEQVDLSNVTRDNKTGQLSAKKGSVDFTKIIRNVKSGQLSQK